MKRLAMIGAAFAAILGAARVLKPRARVAVEKRTGGPGPRVEGDIQLGGDGEDK